MGALFKLGLIIIQLTSSFAIPSIPLKCFLLENNTFDSSSTITARNAANAITLPQFGIVRADSHKFDTGGWMLDTSNLEFHGLDDAIVDEIRFDFVQNVSYITFHTDMLVTYDYVTNGSLFDIPIYGEGFTEVPLDNIQIGMRIPFNFLDVNGTKYIELKNYNFWYTIHDKAEFRFSNLYNGNKEQSDKMHNLLNENWKFINSQYGRGFFVSVADHFFNVLKNYMLKIPLNDFSTC